MTERRPLILITNDDGIDAKGVNTLAEIACSHGDVVVVAPAGNASGLAHSITGARPLRVTLVDRNERCVRYKCDGTPVDCVKVAMEHCCPRRPDLILSGINHGSNSSINVLYSGTMGAVIEASVSGYNAVGFSLLDNDSEADFEAAVPYIHSIIDEVLLNGLPDYVALNVNIPVTDAAGLKGVKVCRQSRARWEESYEKRVDPRGVPYYWLTGHFECHDNSDGTDEGALMDGYISIVPTLCDFTDYNSIETMKARFCNANKESDGLGNH